MQLKNKTGFLDHFNSLLIPLKDTSKVFVGMFSAIAKSFENLKSYTEDIIQRHFISNDDFEEFSKDRGIVRIKNESSQSFYSRVLGAYSFLKNSSTKQGIIDILRSFTEKEFRVRELYREDFVLGNPNEKLGITTQLKNSLASYYFTMDFTNPLTVEEKQYLTEILDLYKPAHIGFHLNARIVDDWKLVNKEEKLGINTYL
ncbi:MAG: hypothetical protein ACRCWI_05880 [Brevinema sp.]